MLSYRLMGNAFVPLNFMAPEGYFLKHDHWLGSSRDGRVWALAVDESNPTRNDTAPDATLDEEPSNVVAFLLDPPKRNFHAIATILLRVHIASVFGRLSVMKLADSDEAARV